MKNNNLVSTITLLLSFSIKVESSSSNVVYSNDTMSLTLSSSTRNLMDITSSSHTLQWNLKNTGKHPGTFLISQHSPHGVMGLLRIQTVHLFPDDMVTIKVENIRIPTYSPKNVVFSLIVKKSDPSQEEIENSSPGYRDSISSSVILNLVPGTFSEEKQWPMSHMWISESGCDHVDSCQMAHWLVQFSSQDQGSGIFNIGIKSYQSNNEIYWWHNQFRVGTHNKVEGGAWVSCCTDIVVLEVEDVAMNKIRTLVNHDGDIDWTIIIPVVTSVSVIIIIILIGVIVCICKTKYSPVNSQYV